ncbi:MAG: type IV toxin-antitoxin system AbiEi family antitoxin domain-containing protein [Endozoicomonas sp.]
MSIAQKAKKKIDQWPDSKVFRLQDFDDYKESPKAVSETLSRLTKQGAIVRFSKGRFYKPKATRYGNVRPGQDAFVEAFLYRSNRKKKERVAYITGASLFYEWGLTTQIPSRVQIASTEGSFDQNIKGIRISAKKSNVDKLNENRVLVLQILDIVKSFKTIPEADPENIVKVLKRYIETFNNTSIRDAERIALKYYRPSVQALLGALMEDSLNYKSKKLKDNLSPLSQYRMGVNSEIIKSAENWQLH